MKEGKSILGVLFDKHYLDLKRLIAFKFNKTPHDAEEVVQDAFDSILRMDNVTELGNPKAYLYKTAHNLALNRIRKNKRHAEYVESQSKDDSYDLCPERVTSAAKDLQRIEGAIGKLPEKYRKTFLLSRVESKSYREISDMLGISVSTVEKHIIRTLKFLRDELDRSEVMQ